MAVLGFDETTKHMRLESVHPGFTVDQVIDATGFELPVADGAGETPAPSDSELRAIRKKLDPDGKLLKVKLR
jgi:glutaconate CoA-transferase subunit B